MVTMTGWGLPEWPGWLLDMMGTTRVAQMATWPRWRLPERRRWLPCQDGDYQSGPDGYLAMMGTTRVAQMATWPRWGQPERHRWLQCQDGDYQIGVEKCLLPQSGTVPDFLAKMKINQFQ